MRITMLLLPPRAWGLWRRPVVGRFASTSSAEVSARLQDEGLLEHLVCPISKLPLRYDPAQGLVICPEIRVAYPIRDGIPLLVPSEGRILRDDEEA